MIKVRGKAACASIPSHELLGVIWNQSGPSWFLESHDLGWTKELKLQLSGVSGEQRLGYCDNF